VFFLMRLISNKERPFVNLLLRIIRNSWKLGVGGGRAERRVTDTVTGRKQFLFFQMLAHSKQFLFFAY